MPYRTIPESHGFKAVCFDLFDTLIHFDTETYLMRHEELARRIGIDTHRLRSAWSRTRNPAMAGMFPTHLDRVTAVMKELGIEDETRIDIARRAEREAIRAATTVVSGIDRLLMRLCRLDKALAIISNATAAGLLIIEETRLQPFFREFVFSYDVQLRKPDPSIYTLTCDRLGVASSQSAYVADGAKGELAGALLAGLNPIRFDPFHKREDVPVPPGTLDCHTVEELERVLLD